MVASVNAVTSADYYLQADHTLHSLTGVGSSGVWYGWAAEKLGFRGPVLPVELQAAVDGLSTDRSQSFVQKQKGKAHQPGWDITFSAPKSVSALWSQLDAPDRHKIEDIVMRAAKRAVDYLDANALIARRGNKGNYIENARGVYALFPHGTSRAQDPQLHVHTLIFNFCIRNSGKTGAVRSWDIYHHKMAAGAVFRLELAHLIQKELGLRVTQDRWAFQVDGVSKKLCDEQSKRRKLIEKLSVEEGWTSPKTMAQLAIATRGPKESVALGDCLAHWAKEGAAQGFGRGEAEKLMASGQERLLDVGQAIAPEVKQEYIEAALKSGVKDVSAYKAYFPVRTLLAHVASKAVASGADATEILTSVDRALPRFESRVNLEPSAYDYYSTRENIAAEKELLDRSTAGKDSSAFHVTAEAVAYAEKKVTKQLTKKIGVPVSLTGDQAAALRHVTLGNGDLKIIKGAAGTGKTQVLQAARIAWEESGYQVLGTSILGRAALGLESATGIQSVTVEHLMKKLRPNLSAFEYAKIFVEKSTDILQAAYWEGKRAGAWMRNPYKQAAIESFRGIKNIIKGVNPRQKAPDCKLTKKTILVVDEAAMLPTQTLLALKQECDKVGAKLVLVGDQAQLPPIEPGGPFGSLANRLGHADLTTNVRQRQPWMRQAMEAIKTDPAQALQIYAENERLHFEKHKTAAIEKLVTDFCKLNRSELYGAIALTATKEDTERVNEAVQAKRKAMRELGLFSLRLPNGERVHVNDRVMLTFNDYKHGYGVRNGLVGTVVKLHRPRGIMGPGAITIQLSDSTKSGLFRIPKKPPTVNVDLKKYPHVQLGYAATTHKLQGITVEKSFVLMGEMLSREMAYTQLSRASHDCHVYAPRTGFGDPIMQLSKQLEKNTAKDLAHDHTITRQQKKQSVDQALWL